MFAEMIKLHKVWLLLCAIAGIPVAGLSTLLLVGAIGVAVETRAVDFSDVVGVALLIMALCLFVWCIILGLSLRGQTQIPERTRPRLLAFYALAGIGTAITTTTSTWSRDGSVGMIFSPAQAVVATGFFVLPIMALWIERNRKRNTARYGVPTPVSVIVQGKQSDEKY